MRRSLFRIVLVLGLLSGLLTSGAVAADTGGQGAAESWIVVLDDGVAPAQAASALASAHGGEVGHVYEHVLGGFSLTASPQAAAALANNPMVDRVEADREVSIAADIPTGVSRIDAAHDDPYQGPPDREPAHDHGHTGDGIHIAILDTGIDSNHPDLDVDTSHGLACITNTTEDVHGHGTHVAGTAAATGDPGGIVGVAPDATLIPVKVLNDSGFGTWASVLCGVDHVTGLHNSGALGGPLVANSSLGGTYNPNDPDQQALLDGYADSVDAGVVHTVAAGNSSADADGFIPARSAEAITVSSLTDFDGIPGGLAGCQFMPWGNDCDDTFAGYSNYGEVIDVIAPGTLIESTWPGGGRNTISGTSMAAPHAAGVAALVLAEDDTLAPDDVRLLLQETGECPDETWNNGGAVCDSTQGQWSGDPDGIAEPLVNAFRAADAASGPNYMFVELTAGFKVGTPTEWSAQVHADVTNEDGDPVADARVSGRFRSALDSSIGWCVTDSTGRCSMWSHAMDRQLEPEVTYVLRGAGHADYTLHPNEVGKSITIQQ